MVVQAFDEDEKLPEFKQEKKVETQKAVATKANNLPSTDLAKWGKREIRTTSITIPRILKMEFQSDKVKEQKAKFGEFRDSLTDQVYGDLEHPFSIIPIYAEEKWAVYDITKVRGKVEVVFREMVPVTHENENLKFETETVKNTRILDVYCLIPDELEISAKPLPKILSFRGGSGGKAGKKLFTQMYVVNESKGLPPCATIIEVSGKSKQGPNDSTYVELDVKPSRLSNKNECDVAFEWFKAIAGGNTVADDATPEVKVTEEVRDF
jgi:hypothetical protein